MMGKINGYSTVGDLKKDLGLCNVHVAQLFRLQAQLKKETEGAGHTSAGTHRVGLGAMGECPLRSYDPAVLQH